MPWLKKYSASARVETVTGRLVCQACADTITAMTAAVMTGGDGGDAVAVRGWLRRIRRWTKPKPTPPDPPA